MEILRRVEGTQVHKGFQHAYVQLIIHTIIGYLTQYRWSTISQETIAAVKNATSENSNFKIVVSGHSLGGALASLAAISLKMTFPDKYVLCIISIMHV